MATQVTVNAGQGSTKVTVITGQGSTTYSVSTGARGPAGSGGVGGGVTNLATGTGLTGGPVTTTGTIALANTAVTAGGYQSPYIQVDAQGRLTKALDEPCSDEIHFSGGASLNAGILTATGVVEWETPIVSSVARTGIFAGIATFTQFSILEYTFNSTAAVEEFLQVTGGGFTHVFNAVKSEIIVQSSTEIITRLTGSVTNLGGTALPTRPAIAIFRVTPAGASGGAFTLTLKVQKEFLYTGTSPVVVTGRAISLVATTSAGTYATPSSITVDATGRVTAATAGAGAGSGTVQSIIAGTGLSGGTITTTGTIALNNTAVTAAAYTNANITVDAQGRITAAASGSAAGNITGTAPIVVTSGAVSLDTTLPNAYAFTSTTRPTSSGTGTPAATSLLKRDDVDTRMALNYLRGLYLWSNKHTDYTANNVGTGSNATNIDVIDLQTGATASSVSFLRSNIFNFRVWHLSLGTGRGIVNWSLRTIYNLRIVVSDITGADTVARFLLGQIVTNTTAQDLTSADRGIGFKIIAGLVYVQVANTATLTTTSTSTTIVGVRECDLTLDADGAGNWVAYINGANVASGTGAPTGNSSGGNNALCMSVTNGTTAAQRQLYVVKQSTLQIP